MAHSEMWPSVVRLIVLLIVIAAATISILSSTPPPSPPDEGQQIGKILSVRKVLENRYPQVHYYFLYFAVRASHQTYCVEYETPVLDEIDDLFSAKYQNLAVVIKSKSFTLRTLKGRKIKGRFVDQKQC